VNAMQVEAGIHAEVATPVRSLAGGLLRCPACRRLTGSLKRYRLIDLLLFAGAFWFVRTATHTACPGCMRGLIVRRTMFNIITANVLWPIFVLPLHALDLLRTFTDGPSDSVQRTG
jgi:hypothetical protein